MVVVGAGVAGTRAAETLRQEGYDGDLTIVGAERHAPYHRPPLSKKLLTGKVHRAGVDLAPQFEHRCARAARRIGASSWTCPRAPSTCATTTEDLTLPFDGLVIASGASHANGRAARSPTGC